MCVCVSVPVNSTLKQIKLKEVLMPFKPFNCKRMYLRLLFKLFFEDDRFINNIQKNYSKKLTSEILFQLIVVYS